MKERLAAGEKLELTQKGKINSEAEHWKALLLLRSKRNAHLIAVSCLERVWDTGERSAVSRQLLEALAECDAPEKLVVVLQRWVTTTGEQLQVLCFM